MYLFDNRDVSSFSTFAVFNMGVYKNTILYETTDNLRTDCVQ